MTQFLNTGLTQQQFLDEYWQKKPLLMRQAFGNFQPNISPEQLIDWACQDDIEARLIQQDQHCQWHLKDHHLSHEDFQALPDTHWTVLVQDMDKHHPDFQDLLNLFNFIPDWRRDDLMISYASEHGSVGAHVDSYDVFLLQGMGTRRWEISDHPIHNPELMDHQDLSILEHFSADLYWDLAPGDCLYLPPHFAHRGVALTPCMTYSIGFRSLSHVELLDGLIDTMLENNQSQARYSDPNLQVTKHAHEINAHAICEVKRLLHNVIDQADTMIMRTLGRCVTETKPSLLERTESMLSEPVDIQACTEKFDQGLVLKQSRFHRFAWCDDNQSALLFYAGDSYRLDVRDHAILLCENTLLTSTHWRQLCTNENSTVVLCTLISEGMWMWSTS